LFWLRHTQFAHKWLSLWYLYLVIITSAWRNLLCCVSLKCQTCFSLHKATIFYSTVQCVHLEDMVRYISYCQCGKVWSNCSQSLVKLCWLLLIFHGNNWRGPLITNHRIDIIRSKDTRRARRFYRGRMPGSCTSQISAPSVAHAWHEYSTTDHTPQINKSNPHLTITHRSSINPIRIKLTYTAAQ